MLKKIIALSMATMIAVTPVMGNDYPSPTGQRVVTQGMAQIQVEPDIANVNIGVTTEAKTSTEAADENNAISKNVLETIKSLGINEKDIQTNYYNSYARYNYSDNGESSIVGYVVNNSFKVIIRDIENVGTIIAKATEAGANSNGGINFDVDNKEEYYQDALKLAIKQAVAKGNAMGEAVGYSNLKVTKIEELSSSSYAREASNMLKDYGAAESSVPVEAGLININANVTIVME